MTAFLASDPIQSTQLIPGGNTPASGGLLFCYQVGSSTKQNTYTDATASTARTNPIVLDSGGNIPGNGEVWIASTAKFVLAPSNDTDPPASPYWSRDNLPGVNDPSQVQSEWIPSGLSPTFVSGSSFIFSGDQTGTFTPGRRLKTLNTAGTFYSTIGTSAFSASTTIGIQSDTIGIDSGLSAVSYGLINPKNTSLPLIVSVLNFGAKGDGVTDDATSTINTIVAVAAAITPSSGQQATVYVPAGIYQLGSQVTVKRGVRLVGPGTFRPVSAAINLFLVEPGASIDINVDTTNVTYTGQAITLDATISGGTFDIIAGRHTELKATLLGTNGQGTAVFYHENDVQGIAYVSADFTINGFSKGIDLFAESALGFINGNRFNGYIRAATTAIDLRGAGNPFGNLFDMEIQAVAGQTARAWFVEAGSFNQYIGYIFDQTDLSTSAVEFGAGAGTQNKCLVPGDLFGKIINNSSSTTNVAGKPTVSESVQVSAPVLSFGGLSVGITYVVHSCRYSTIGQRIFFDLQITLSSKGSSSGAAVIQLPVTINASAFTSNFSIGNANNFAIGTVTQLLAFGSAGTTNLNLFRYAVGAQTVLTDADFANNTDIRISGSYEY